MTRERARGFARAWFQGVLLLGVMINVAINGSFLEDYFLIGILVVLMAMFWITVETIP